MELNGELSNQIVPIGSAEIIMFPEKWTKNFLHLTLSLNIPGLNKIIPLYQDRGNFCIRPDQLIRVNYNSTTLFSTKIQNLHAHSPNFAVIAVMAAVSKILTKIYSQLKDKQITIIDDLETALETCWDERTMFAHTSSEIRDASQKLPSLERDFWKNLNGLEQANKILSVLNSAVRQTNALIQIEKINSTMNISAN